MAARGGLGGAAERRGGARTAVLAGRRDSGASGQDADLVIFIHRPEMYRDLREKAEADGKNLEGKAIIDIAKHRNGPTGTVDLHFEKRFTRFDNYTERQDDGYGG